MTESFSETDCKSDKESGHREWQETYILRFYVKRFPVNLLVLLASIIRTPPFLYDTYESLNSKSFLRVFSKSTWFRRRSTGREWHEQYSVFIQFQLSNFKGGVVWTVVRTVTFRLYSD